MKLKRQMTTHLYLSPASALSGSINGDNISSMVVVSATLKYKIHIFTRQKGKNKLRMGPT